MTLCCADRCRYVRDKDACGADDQYIPYLQLFYCASGNLWLLVSVFLVVWLLLLFYAMSVVAEVFLCPAVQVGSAAVPLHVRSNAICNVSICCRISTEAHARRPCIRAVLHLGSHH